MPGQIWLCPSRGRPGSITELRAAWDGVTGPEAELLVAVDDDDPELDGYLAGGPVRVLDTPRGLGPVINALAAEYAPQCEATGFLGDDHRPRTPGWAGGLAAALHGRPGVAYGNDLFQCGKLPTAVLIASPVLAALGYMVPPGVEHLFMDDFWKRLGEDLGCLEYLPDLIIEHCHPVAGKGTWDASYARSNSPEQWSRDSAAYQGFLAERWPGDLSRLLAAVKAQPRG